MSRQPKAPPAADAAEAAAATAAASAGRSAAANAGPSPESTIVVQGPGKGRRRAGYSFGAEPVIIPLADLTEAQLLAIQSDPELLVAVNFNPETV